MKKNKFLLCLSISCFTLSSTISSLLAFTNQKEENNNLNINVNNQQKIKITRIKYSSSHYGKERILFEVNPKINTDEIAYSLKYDDNDEIEADIFDVLFMPSSNYIDITCLKPFEKRVVLTLYAASNENVKASINIDFKEKITLDPTLQISENSPLTVDTNLTSTGGSIKVDKTIKEEKISFSDSFVSNLKDKLKERFIEKYYSNPQTTSYYENSAIYKGLNESYCAYWFSNSFTYNDFLKSIYYEVDYSWIESDSDYETFAVDRIYAYDLLKDDFFEIFNGINPVFSYSCVINKQKYNSELGINIDKININNIQILDKDVVF